MRQLAAGVFVITSRLNDQLHATTATAFLPLSAESPLVLLCIHQNSDTHKALAQTPRFGVSVLSRTQAALAWRFDSKTPGRYRFDDLPRIRGPGGSEFFQGSVAHGEVETVSTSGGGDHTVFIGKVLWSQTDTRWRPLVYHRGDHHGLATLLESEAPVTSRLTSFAGGVTGPAAGAAAESQRIFAHRTADESPEVHDGESPLQAPRTLLGWYTYCGSTLPLYCGCSSTRPECRSSHRSGDHREPHSFRIAP
jgi:flavin reductase (DIM6/NTAB) family NADH-FMN oxidoreductase RutF